MRNSRLCEFLLFSQKSHFSLQMNDVMKCKFLISSSIREEHETLAGLRAELQEAAHSIRQEHSDNKTLLELNRLQERCLHLEAELKEAKNQLCVSAVVCVSVHYFCF